MSPDILGGVVAACLASFFLGILIAGLSSRTLPRFGTGDAIVALCVAAVFSAVAVFCFL